MFHKKPTKKSKSWQKRVKVLFGRLFFCPYFAERVCEPCLKIEKEEREAEKLFKWHRLRGYCTTKDFDLCWAYYSKERNRR